MARISMAQRRQASQLNCKPIQSRLIASSLSHTYLAHDELESIFFFNLLINSLITLVIIIIIIGIIIIIIINIIIKVCMWERQGACGVQVVGHTIQEQGINSACAERVFRIDVGMSKGCGNGEAEVHKPNLCNVGGQMGHMRDQCTFCPQAM